MHGDHYQRIPYPSADVLCIFADVDSDLSDTDLELDDVQSECESEHGDRDGKTHPAVHLLATFRWDGYPDTDPWGPSWLPHFIKQ